METSPIPRNVMLGTIVIPVYNEEDNIPVLYQRLVNVMKTLPLDYEIIFVDDGSTDSSLVRIRELSRSDENVYYISFTRNFGHEAASTAGLDAAKGDCIILMDADLQDPPELIPKMIELWRQGYHLVYAKRRRRAGESLFKRISAYAFYRILNLMSDLKFPLDTGDFRLMDKVVVEDFKKCREKNRFVRGLTAWVGYNQVGIEYDRDERYAGRTKYNPLKLLLLSIDVITGFSIVPLRIVTYAGFLITALSLCMTLIVIIQKIFFGLNIPGYALLTSGLFFLGGVQTFFLGILGEYVGRIYREVQKRPLYLIQEQRLKN
jgi:dolichol-phosphate mannosyltransferase